MSRAKSPIFLSQNIDFTTLRENTSTKIGTYIDGNGVSHNMYKLIIKKTDFTTTSTYQYKIYTVNLSGYTILETTGQLYRSDANGVINQLGSGDASVTYTNNGDAMRVYYYGNSALTNATIYINIIYID